MAFAFTNKGPTPGLVDKLSGSLGFKPKPTYPTTSGNPIPKPTYPTPSGNPISQGSNPGLIQPHTQVKPTTPVKKTTTTDTSGNTTTTEYHAPEKKTETPKLTTPQVGTPAQNAQTVLNTGNQTPIEKTATERLYQSGQMTPEEQKANEDVRIANEIQKAYGNVQSLAPYAEAKMYSDRARTPAEIQDLMQAPDLAGRASATQGLLGSLGNIYGSSRVAGANAALQGTQTAAGRGLSAAQSGLIGAQNQASRAQTGAGAVLTAGLPQVVSPGLVPFNPLTGEQGNLTGTQGEGGGLFGAGAIQGQIALGQQYPALVSAHSQAQGIQSQIDTYLNQNPQLNPSNITDINKISQWLLGGKLGDPKYQTLANYLQEYVNTLAPILGVGGDVTNLKTEIAQSFVNGAANGQSISQVLKNIDQLAATKLNAMKEAGSGKPAPTISTKSSTPSGSVITTPDGLTINPNF